MLLPKIKNIPKNTNGRLAIPALAGLLVNEQAENELESLIKDMAKRGFPLTESNIRDLAHQHATKMGIEGLSSKNEQAGWYWLKGFLRRHPTISVKSLEALSSYRASGMNRQVVETKRGFRSTSHCWSQKELLMSHLIFGT